ncbi:MAG: DUF6788 family protein, partial [Candidatus Dormibacteraceae bacterium]
MALHLCTRDTRRRRPPMARRTTSPEPRFIRGSVITQRRRCGKPTCRCADGESLHESQVLGYSENGRTRLLTLPSNRVPSVRA